MAKMNETDILMCRAIFDSIIKIHPAHDLGNRAALADLFDLDEEQLDALHALAMWICGHELEYAHGIGNDPANMIRELRQVALQQAYDLLYQATGGPQNVQTAHEQVIKAMSLLVAVGAQPHIKGKD